MGTRGRGGYDEYRDFTVRRGRGRGHRGGRSRGGYSGGHRGGYQQQSKSVVRFHDTADEALDREVLIMNKDHPGAQQIRVLKFAKSQWEAVESLTRGDFYYHNRIEKKKHKKETCGITRFLRDKNGI